MRISEIISNSKYCKITDGSGTIQYYKKRKIVPTFRYPYYIQKERRPSGNSFLYSYEEHKSYRLSKVALLNSQKLGLNSFTFHYPDSYKKKPSLEVTSYDGRKVRYEFDNTQGENYLKRVIRSDAPLENYCYNNGRLTEKSLPNGRYQRIAYYNEDKNQDVGGRPITLLEKGDQRPKRVKLLSAPVGADSTPIVTHRFFYSIVLKWKKPAILEKNGYYPGQGITEVRDVYNNKTEYHFNSDQRLWAVLKYCGREQVNGYSGEYLFWRARGSKDETNLISRTFVSHTNKTEFCRYFVYDNAGNIISEHLYGNLSGNNPEDLVVNPQGIPITPGCESYGKT
jgi:hypothetical protein